MRILLIMLAVSAARAQVADSDLVGNVTGTVVDAATGAGIPGAGIVLLDGSSPKLRALTDASGRFLINAVPTPYPSKAYSVVASARGYRSQAIAGARVLPGAVMAMECRFRLSRPGGGFTGWASAGPSFFYSHERALRPARIESGRIFATREGLVGRTTANGHVIRSGDRFAALPSRRALSSNGGREYRVRLTYHGRSITAPVWDIGPWNIRDDYWNPSSERERFGSLPRGKPQAQAAYLEGHNGGRDGFGRKVLNPAGIDLSDAVFRDDLRMRDNDWIGVEYLWDHTLVSSREPAEGRQRAPVARRRVPIEELIAIAEAILMRTRR